MRLFLLVILLCYRWKSVKIELRKSRWKNRGKNFLWIEDRSGRNPKNLFATKENLFELIGEKVGEQTVFTIESYM